MARRTLGVVSTLHFLLGVICSGAGIVWICLHFLQRDFASPALPQSAFLVMCPEIICGFFILVSGLCGFCTKDRLDCCGYLLIVSNIFNMLVWCPVLVAGYILLVLTIYRDGQGEPAQCMDNICLPNDWDNLNFTYLVPPNQGKDWVYAFPGVGISVGFIDFIVSIACLIIVCTMRRKMPKQYDSRWDPTATQRSRSR